MKTAKIKLVACLLFICFTAGAQKSSNKIDSAFQRHLVDSINRLLDHAVVNKQIATLNKHYAEDFVFTHSTGLVDSKYSWIKNVQDTTTHFISREHDSTVVELHKDLAIVSGTLTVQRRVKDKVAGYVLRYIRVFVYRQKNWQLLSHRSTAEWEL